MRLARAETGTSVNEWLKVPVFDLPDWVETVRSENELLKREIEKQRRNRR